jgi:hypothetical protein
MNKFQRSWALMKSSLSVIGRNKELLVFPIVVFSCTVAIALFFLAPPLLRPTGHPYTSGEHWQAIGHSLFKTTGNDSHVVFTPAAVAYMTLLYFVSMFIATFCNVAFYHEIMAALSGQPISIVRGLKFASTRLSSIFIWTLFAGLVGLLIKTIEERMEIVGQIIGRIVGIAWSVAAVFAVPVIVRQESTMNPLAILRSSAGALKRTWGEALIGYAGLSFANGIIAVMTAVVTIGSIMLSGVLHTYLFALMIIPTWFLLLFAWAYLTSVAGHVYRGALYLYASEGIVPAPYDQDMLNMAWKFNK